MRPTPSDFRARFAPLSALLLAALVLPALAPGGAGAARALLDTGRLTVSLDGQPARAEEFAYERVGDSLVVRAASAPWREAPSELRFDKRLQLVVQAAEYDLVSYSSEYKTASDTLRRGLSLAHGDTLFTIWRESHGHGTGDVMALPPGRLYVLDTSMFTLFGYVGWTMQDRVFDRRPLNMLVLGARDTIVAATVTDAGTQELTWNGQKVATRKLLIGDQQTTVEAWFTPDGHMLRLEQPKVGIRVERQAPTTAPPGRKEEPAPKR